MSSTPPSADTMRGLDDDEAARRLLRDGANVLPGGETRRWLHVLRGVLAEPMFLMLIAAATIYAWLGDRAEAVFLGVSVAIVVAITVVQEWRAREALAALRDLATPVAHVIRSGNERRVAATEVVVGDVLVLREGDRVPADGLLLEGTLMIDESLLTGESVPVEHGPGLRPPTDPVRAGTLVVGGIARARVTATGGRTAFGDIGRALAGEQVSPSPMQRAARRLVRFFAIAAVLLALGVGAANWWSGRSFVESALASIALAMAILPEEIPVVLAVFYALGARRIARRGVLARRLAAVETMGAISLLAVDKTGTLTQNRMAVAMFCDAPGHVQDATSPVDDAVDRLACTAAAACDPRSIDPTDMAIVAHTRRRADGPPPECAAVPVATFPIGDGRSFVSRVYASGDEGRWHIATKGAPEAVFALCDIPPESLARWSAQAATLAARGLRVLAVARATLPAGTVLRSPAERGHELLGLVALADPLRTGVHAAVAECFAAGIRVVMLTGDHPATAVSIARQAGLSCAHVLTGADIDAVDDDELARRVAGTDVYARVHPLQKLRLVHAFRRHGDVIGMTGDGVNDAPALRSADVGVAMGIRGTDVAREAADLVLLNDRFDSLVAAIRLGRRVYDNIRRSMRFIAAAHVPVVCLAVAPLVMGWPPLLLPVQIALLEMIIDPSCSLVFEAMPEDDRVMRRPPRRTSESPFAVANLAVGLVQGAGLGAILVGGHAWSLAHGLPFATAGQSTFLSLLATTLLLVLDGTRGRYRRMAPWLAAVVAATLVIGAAATFLAPVRSLLGFEAPVPATPFVVAGCTLAGGTWLALVSILSRRWASRHPRRIDDPSPHATSRSFLMQRRPIHEDPDSRRRECA